ncbi:MAG: methyltransferase domain-containing protein [Oscillospiraceae bacterium]|nr:methyltransferase domain-containing protein [Oscillospiraceae bacterium]
MNEEYMEILERYYNWESEMGENYREMYFSNNIFERYEHRFRLKTALKMISLSEEDKVLDLGCAEGYITYHLARTSKNVIGADISKMKLEKSHEIARLFPKSNKPEFVYVDANKRLPFEDGTFDTIVCLETIEHTLFPDKVLSELSRILDDVGSLILSVPTWVQYGRPLDAKISTRPKLLMNSEQFASPFDGHIWDFSLESCDYLLNNSGFKVVERMGAISFNTPILHTMRNYKYTKRLSLLVQWIGDVLQQRCVDNTSYSRYLIYKLQKRI